MEILAFDLSGKFAHFRKFYTNNTALSFTIPPRTTLMGIVGAILGKPRDTYYEEFSSDKLRFGIQVRSSIKKTFHRVNYLKVEDNHDFRGKKDHVQTPVELISGNDVAKDNVRYRIYVAPGNNNNQSFEVLKQALISNQICYNITFGTANHSATLENIAFFEEKDIEASYIENEFINLHSACNSENVSGIQFKKENQYNFIEEELMPADFKANYDREVVKMNRVIYTTGALPLTVKLSGTIYKIQEQDQTLNIQFLE